MENSPTSFAGNSVVVGLNDFKFGMETRFVVLLAISKFPLTINLEYIDYLNLGKSIVVCIIMFLMMLYANHQYKAQGKGTSKEGA